MADQDPWIVREETFDPEKIHHKETIFTIGNGYLSTRGTFEEGYPGERSATLIHGVFDDIPIVFTELANAPNWTALDIRLEGELFSLNRGEILSFERWLDLRNGLLLRQVRWRSPSGRTVDLRFERFTSLADPHMLAVRLSLTPLDFSGPVQVHGTLNGSEDTLGMVHWAWKGQHTGERTAWLHTCTRSSDIDLALAMRLAVQGGHSLQQTGWDLKNYPSLVADCQAIPGETIVVEKLVCLFTSRDLPDPLNAALQKLDELPEPGWVALFEASRAAWERQWERSDVILEGDNDIQLALRFNLYQLLIAAPRTDERVSIGAKTLSGYGYRGHAFWDTEIFMLPFFTYTQPEIARNLLSYRWHNLPGARRKAAGNGYQGAQYPWESAATGDEVTPTWVPHPTDPTQLVRIWTGDIEIHVSSDIAYAIWQYWKATGDEAFMLERGAPVILETARFWASRAEWDDKTACYEFNDVIGPDEYHDHVDNNAYTNYFARWHLLTALSLVDWLKSQATPEAQHLLEQLELEAGELARWRQLAWLIDCPYDPETGLIEQFDGYFQRQDVDLSEYADRSESMQVILGIEGANRTQVLKQPDVLMLFYLLPNLFDERTIRVNYDYYTPRTDHSFGSSLGPAVQAILACWMGRVEEAYQHFVRAAHADLYDVRGNAGDGIHGASAGGLWQAIVFGFGGLKFTEDGWTTNPRLPSHWERLAFKFFYRGKVHQVEARHDA